MQGRGRLSLLILGGCLLAPPVQAQWVTQTVSLRVGWNAVFLEVEPYPPQCDQQFAGLPINSVWTYDSRFSPVEFVQDPGELSPDLPEWRFYAPPVSPHAFATNLFVLQAETAYLIHASAAATWNIVGQPQLGKTSWKAGSYNLVGFPVDPAQPPTFAAWFAGSADHAPLDIRTLGATDQWERVTTPASTTIQAGRAYWVFCYEPSEFQGPVNLGLDGGTALNYERTLVEHEIEVQRLGSIAKTITVRTQPSAPAPDPGVPAVAGGVPLEYYGKVTQGDVTNYGFHPLPATLTFAATETTPKTLRLAAERAQMTAGPPGSVYQALLEVTDGAGYRGLVGVRSLGRAPAALPGKPGEAAVTPGSWSGLWVGAVNLDGVSEPQQETSVVTETPAEFSFRVIMHVDAVGAVRMLNEVTQFWRAGTMAPDPNNPDYDTVDEAGRYILVTPTAPQSLLDEIGTTVKPAALRDGRLFARRISTVAYSLLDVEGNAEEPEMTPSGEFGADGSTLTVTLVIEDTDPMNPFHHQYHPKHRYPDQGTTPFPANDWTVNWSMRFTFAADPPDGRDTAGWGDTVVGGTYEEEVTGLKSDPIVAHGTFRLQRASTVAVLNDGLGS